MYHDTVFLSYILSSPSYISSPNTIILKQPLGEESKHPNSSIGFITWLTFDFE